MVGSTMAQAVRRWPFTSEARFRSQLMRFLMDRVALGQFFLRILRLSPFSIIPLFLLFIYMFQSNIKIKGRRLRTFQKIIALSKSGSIRQSNSITILLFRGFSNAVVTSIFPMLAFYKLLLLTRYYNVQGCCGLQYRNMCVVRNASNLFQEARFMHNCYGEFLDCRF